MRIRDAFLYHGFLFESLNEIFEAISSVILIVHALLRHQSCYGSANVILICVLVGIVTDVAHDKLLCNGKIVILGIQIRLVSNQVAGKRLNYRQILPPEIWSHFF